MRKIKLPDGWHWKLLKEVGSISQGGTPRKDIDEYWNGTIPFITGADIVNLYVSEARSFITEKGLYSGKTEKCEKGDLLIVSRTRVGRVGIAATTLGISQDVTVLKVADGFDEKYLALFLKFKSRQLEEACQGATIKGLTRDFIENIIVPIPAQLKDQITIANKLESKMVEVEKMRQAAIRQKEAVEVFREALLRRHFPYEEGDPLPKGWQWYELGDILKFKNGINFSSSEVGQGTLTLDVFNMYTENLYPKLNNLYRVNKYFSNEYLLKEDDILFVRSSVKKEGVGWPTVFKGYKEPVSFCGFIIRGRLFRDDIDPKYLVLYSRMASVREKFISASGQTTITNISQDNLKRVKIPVANKMSEQKEIAQKIETRLLGLETLQHASERQSEAIQALPAAILREVFDFQETNT